ncbi:MAG: glutamate--tRNA ligase family protein [Terrimicrobiaceae bacterium]|nr:glutamate--tRNA ligase family protein [Terrimicrobiaceae bacterium]
MAGYRGRLAPTPTGRLHVGHAATFWTAFQRARAAGGELLMRIEDLDVRRCREEFVAGVIEDLTWLGVDWDGPLVRQRERRDAYLRAWRLLRDGGWIYPCRRSRREVGEAVTLAPHDDEPIFPIEWRGDCAESRSFDRPDGVNWRFRVPDRERMGFVDGRLGPIDRVAGEDFGDFLVWNRDNVPAYELAVVVDDLAQGITEIVRGEDLLTSTARQILVARALGGHLPSTFHTPLVRGWDGRRLAKRDGALEIRALREAGRAPEEVLKMAFSFSVSDEAGAERNPK